MEFLGKRSPHQNAGLIKRAPGKSSLIIITLSTNNKTNLMFTGMEFLGKRSGSNYNAAPEVYPYVPNMF